MAMAPEAIPFCAKDSFCAHRKSAALLAGVTALGSLGSLHAGRRVDPVLLFHVFSALLHTMNTLQGLGRGPGPEASPFCEKVHKMGTEPKIGR